MSKNSQYILSQEQQNATLDTKRVASYWKLQFLYQNKLNKIDYSLDNTNPNIVSTPVDKAIKDYIRYVSSNVMIERQNLGEIENYYGVYSGSIYQGINAFVKTNNTLRPAIVCGSDSPLVVRINNKQKRFTNVSVDVISSSSLYSSMSVTLSSNPKFGTEESKYLTEVSYSSITKYGNNNYYIIKINNEYSTVRVDTTNQKLYFEHIGGATRSQWRISNNAIGDVSIIPNNNLTFQLFEIRYLYITESGNVFSCQTEPKAISQANDLTTCTESTYGYNIVDEKWYYYNHSTNQVSVQNIQLIGMIGLNNTTITCAYSLPCYMKKSQKNTIKLRKVNNNLISSVSGNNVLYFNSDVLQIKNKVLNWTFDTISNRNTTFYLYLDEEGVEKVSLLRPYRSEFGGYYLNNRNWRCVGSVFKDATGVLSDPCDFNGSFNTTEFYRDATFARFPLGFEGNVKLTTSSTTNTYNVKDLNYGINVENGTTIQYIGVING